ncbi:glycosyltransferase family 2 protein, partial [Vibrio parahaemolyticus]
MNNPLISVIIPTYNDAFWIEEAIASIQNQTYSNTEIIVVNDGSTEPKTL